MRSHHEGVDIVDTARQCWNLQLYIKELSTKSLAVLIKVFIPHLEFIMQDLPGIVYTSKPGFELTDGGGR